MKKLFAFLLIALLPTTLLAKPPGINKSDVTKQFCKVWGNKVATQSILARLAKDMEKTNSYTNEAFVQTYAFGKFEGTPAGYDISTDPNYYCSYTYDLKIRPVNTPLKVYTRKVTIELGVDWETDTATIEPTVYNQLFKWLSKEVFAPPF